MRGYVSSAEMAMMNSVLDEICLARGYGPGPDRNLVAAQIMDLFRNGVTERSELIDALRVRDMAHRSYEPCKTLKATGVILHRPLAEIWNHLVCSRLRGSTEGYFDPPVFVIGPTGPPYSARLTPLPLPNTVGRPLRHLPYG